MAAIVFPSDNTEYLVNRTGNQTITGQKVFLASSAGVNPLIVKGAASQTAELVQWQDSAGNVVGKIYPSGSIETFGTSVIQKTDGTGRSRLATAVSNSTDATPVPYQYGVLYTFNDTNPGMNTRQIIGRVISQGKDSVGAATNYTDIRFLARDTTDASEDGSIHFYTLTAGITREVANFGDTTLGYNALLLNHDPNVRGLVVRAAAGQNANIAEFQNSAGASLTRITSDGTVVSTRNNPQVLLTDGTNSASYAMASGTGNYAPLAIAGTAVLRSEVVGPGAILSDGPTGAQLNVRSSTGTIARGHTTTSPVFIVRGASSQTANLQDWQNSAGTRLASVSANGIIQGVDTGWHNVGAAGEPAFQNGWFNYDNAAGYIPARFRKHADGTVEVQGLVEGGTANTPVFFLPPGYRIGNPGGGPSTHNLIHYAQANGSGGVGQGTVRVDGAIQGSNTTWSDLGGTPRFLAEA